jgi:hypothetical protein
MNSLITSAIVIALGLSGCSSVARWEGFVYPDKKNTKAHVNIGRYFSYEKCQAAAIEKLNKTSSVQAGKYECGLNCEPQTDSSKPRICEKTAP